MINRVLTVAGSDSIGGAGIQADIKAINHFGGSAACAVTAVTAQDLNGVYDIHYISPYSVKKQLETVFLNGVKSVKIGMLGNEEIASTVFEVISRYHGIKIVLDPVFIATSGSKLITDSAIEIIKHKLSSISYLITPNLFEAEELSGKKINSIEDMISAGFEILKYGSKSVLIKGGHLYNSENNKNGIDHNENIVDVLVTKEQEVFFFKNNRIYAKFTHGTGCALSSSIATLISDENYEHLHLILPKAITYVRNKIHEDETLCY